MIAYQYINDLFKAILSESKAIQGRFFVGYRYGLQDVNYDELGRTLDEMRLAKKYPLVLMAPPHSAYKSKDRWDDYRITLFFMKKTYREDLIPNTKTSGHTVLEDWHDMKRCAINFLEALYNYQAVMSPKIYVYKADHNAVIIPLSQIGADRISGVRVDFDFKLQNDCNVEDYEDEYPTNLNIQLDGHAEHQL